VRRFGRLAALGIAAGITGCASAASTSAKSPSTVVSPSVASVDATTTTVSAPSSAAVLPLRGICPDPVVIQTDWNPEAEHGGIYQLVGAGFKIDTDRKSVRGPLTTNGQLTGVDIEVRAGGPAIGFQSVPETIYRKPDTFLGFVSTDDAVEFSQVAPTVAVLAPLEKGPQMIMWDPATYPAVKSIADLKAAKSPIRYFEGEPYMAFLVDKGIVGAEQLDSSYDGSPKVFTAEKGRIAQQGFASSEPYLYSTELNAWAKPVNYQLVYDTGWKPYPQSLAARPEVIKALGPCFKALVPILQHAQVDYVKAPTATNSLIIDLVKAYNNGWVYSAGIAEYSVKSQLDLGLVGNGTDSTLGNFDMNRVAEFIAAAKPVLAKSKPIAAGLTNDQLVTNEFIDKSIGL
jgi:hypothetical protein